MRFYNIVAKDLTIVGPTTLALINPPANRGIRLVRFSISQHGTTVQSNARISFGRKASAFGTYTAATPEKTVSSDPASYITGGTGGLAGTAGVNASAEGAGAFTAQWAEAFPIFGPGYFFEAGRVDYCYFGADSAAFAIKFEAAPSQLSGWNVDVTFQEF